MEREKYKERERLKGVRKTARHWKSEKDRERERKEENERDKERWRERNI